MQNKPKCLGCYYRATHTQVALYGIVCDYAEKTGKTRTSILTHEELIQSPCPLYIRGRKERKHAPPPQESHDKYNWEKAHSMWESGATDNEIAEAIGCAESTVRKRRYMWGKANKNKKE